MSKLPLKHKIFFITIYSITLLSVFIFIKTEYLEVKVTSYTNILFFSLLVALTETFTVLYKDMSFSTTFAVNIACFFLFGPFSTIIITLLGFSLRILKTNEKYKHVLNTPLYGTIFNYCVLTLPFLFGNYFYTKLGGKFLPDNMYSSLPQLLVFSLLFFIINVLVISVLYSLHNNKNIFYSFICNIRLGILTTLAMAPLGIILVIIFNQYSYVGVLLFIIPIILVRYTFSLYIDTKSQYIQTVDALMRTVEARDKYTEGHSQRVAELVKLIAKELNYNDWKIEKLNIASLLHDVGKVGIDDHILNKPDKLTNEEFSIIKSHPQIGYNILRNIKNMDYIRHIVRHHHERYDGKGYPDGKRADELDLDVFIVQLADSVDAMSSDRPYRSALTKEQIIEELKNYSGTQFHPKVVEAYLSIFNKH